MEALESSNFFRIAPFARKTHASTPGRCPACLGSSPPGFYLYRGGDAADCAVHGNGPRHHDTVVGGWLSTHLGHRSGSGRQAGGYHRLPEGAIYRRKCLHAGFLACVSDSQHRSIAGIENDDGGSQCHDRAERIGYAANAASGIHAALRLRNIRSDHGRRRGRRSSIGWCVDPVLRLARNFSRERALGATGARPHRGDVEAPGRKIQGEARSAQHGAARLRHSRSATGLYRRRPRLSFPAARAGSPCGLRLATAQGR